MNNDLLITRIAELENQLELHVTAAEKLVNQIEIKLCDFMSDTRERNTEDYELCIKPLRADSWEIERLNAEFRGVEKSYRTGETIAEMIAEKAENGVAEWRNAATFGKVSE